MALADGARPLRDKGVVAMLGVLLGIYTLAYLDRQIISLLVTPLKADLGIKDLQISYLQGIAFVLFYTICGLPIGYLVDRFPRRPIIFIGIIWWSACSAASGLADSYTHLLMARFGVGAGEAALLPAAYSMIGDAVERRSVSRAMSIFSLGAIAGGALALSVGGVIAGYAAEAGGIVLPVLGHVKSWQFVFLLIGSIGFPAAFLIFLVPEPVRTKPVRAARTAAGDRNANLAHIAAHRRFYAYHILGFSLLCLLTAGFVAWLPAFFQRAYGWDIKQVGMVIGGLQLATGLIGVLGSGAIADRLQARGWADAHLRLYIVAMPVICAAALAAFWVGNIWLTLAGVAIISVVAPFIAVAASALTLTTPANLRGIMSAVFLFAYNIIGFGLGPTIVAAIAATRMVNGDLGTAMGLMFLIISPVAMLIFFAGLKPMREAISAVSSQSVAQ